VQTYNSFQHLVHGLSPLAQLLYWLKYLVQGAVAVAVVEILREVPGARVEVAALITSVFSKPPT
jgi:type II secretory pathway component PulM